MRQIMMVWLLMLPFAASAQYKGIHFSEFLSWQKVLDSARLTGKKIFVDAFATWCGPCKKMDNEVFIDERIGLFINENFISVKIQFDQTDKDGANTKRWYDDARKLLVDYNIDAFPTFLFINPDGQTIYKRTGLYTTDEFLSIIAHAVDPAKNFTGALTSYCKGNLPTSKMLQLAIMARDLKKDSLAIEVARKYKALAIDNKNPTVAIDSTMPDFLSRFGFLIAANDPLVNFMFLNPQRSDSLMKERYSQPFTDYIIFRTYIKPVIWHNEKYVDKKPKWNAIEKKIAKDFDKTTANRLIMLAKYSFYKAHQDWNNSIKYALQNIESNGIDTTLMGTVNLNNLSYELIFLHGTKKAQLKRAITYMKILLAREADNYFWIDTYANLLYKAGIKSEAISEQKRAIGLASLKHDSVNLLDMERKLFLMETNKPTWLVK